MCNEALSHGFSHIYNMNLAVSLRDIFRKHSHLFEAAAAEGTVDYDTQAAYHCRTLADFDNAITSRTFGFADAAAYYAAAGSAARVPGVAVPLLVVQAADDPIAVERAIPHQALQENPNTILVVTPTGGHLGWCSQELGVLGVWKAGGGGVGAGPPGVGPRCQRHLAPLASSGAPAFPSLARRPPCMHDAPALQARPGPARRPWSGLPPSKRWFWDRPRQPARHRCHPSDVSEPAVHGPLQTCEHSSRQDTPLPPTHCQPLLHP